MSTWYTYSLSDPKTGEVRYIGKSRNPALRLRQHISERAAPNVRAWVASLGAPPVLAVLNRFCGETEALIDEQSRIVMHQNPERLLNSRGFERPKPMKRRFSGMGERILEIRTRLGMTQRHLANVSGVSFQAIGFIERGRNKDLTATIAYLLAQSLGTTVEYLLTGESSHA